MDTQTLLRLARSDPIIARRFGGVFASDQLPNNRGYYRSFIVNTDSSLEKGTHWQAMFFDEADKCTFFCSYGTDPRETLKFLSIKIRQKWNGIRKSYNISERHLVGCFVSIFYGIYLENYQSTDCEKHMLRK
ncbi:uncharacterized protein TNCT_458131 [Trichonephila clavata]|uniref:Uncharacterized protein n=1 Tax=Trichonephila clavata TaxID=2740835 RepID=A0A8X6KWD3_TRICU|nr:uncharacterized protein TNCT_458131 [Trichonephila clavata]